MNSYLIPCCRSLALWESTHWCCMMLHTQHLQPSVLHAPVHVRTTPFRAARPAAAPQVLRVQSSKQQQQRRKSHTECRRRHLSTVHAAAAPDAFKFEDADYDKLADEIRVGYAVQLSSVEPVDSSTATRQHRRAPFIHVAVGVSLTQQELADVVKEQLGGTSLYLVGMMGSGKSTVGKLLSQALGYYFFDLDSLVSTGQLLGGLNATILCNEASQSPLPGAPAGCTAEERQNANYC